MGYALNNNLIKIKPSMSFEIENPENKENINILNVQKIQNEKINISKISLPSLSKLKISKVNSSKIEKSTLDLESSSEREKKNAKKRYQSTFQIYSTWQNESLLLLYGESTYHFDKIMDAKENVIPENFMNRHKINPNIHLKMIDWMVEVLNVYKASPETFFSSVHVMDLFIYRSKTQLRTENIHLIGMTSMFISSKFHEIYPISMEHIVQRIGHNQIHESVIKAQEIKMLNVISFASLIHSSIYEFLKTFFFDFYFNNKESLKSPSMEDIYNKIKETATYLAQILMHFEHFYTFSNCIKAICCIVAGKKIVVEHCSCLFKDDKEEFFDDWIAFLIEQNEFDNEIIESVSNEVYCAYLNYQNSKLINKSLNRFSPLSFKNNLL